jgi:SAM-dependent methyltransferase
MITCRSCEASDLTVFLDLGLMPHSDGLRTPEQVRQPEPKYPLEVAFCPSCALVQITEEVPPTILFGDDYPYHSSFSDYLLQHSQQNVENLISWRNLGPDSQIVELASNDGYLLQYFVERGIPVLGIDPAKGPVEVALSRGIPTRHAFFTSTLADELVAEGIRADVVVANNVLAHVPDLRGFVAGIAKLLKPDGTTSIEAPYVRDLIEHVEFDTIYHEHLCYYSVTAVKALFERAGLHLNRVVHLPIHGGSLRYHASPTADPDGSVEQFLEEERRIGVDRLEFYTSFAERVDRLRAAVLTEVEGLRAGGRHVAAYGAAAKGAILLNACGLDERMIDFVVDRNVHKQGKYMPGVDVPILPPEALLERRPDVCLLLPWNLEKEIVRQQHAFLEAGGRFLIPVPAPRYVDLSSVATD